MTDSELEAELLRLRPRAPSTALEERIAQELAAPLLPAPAPVPASAVVWRKLAPERRRKAPAWLLNLGWMTTGLVAGLVIALARPEVPRDTPEAAPVAATATPAAPPAPEAESLFEPASAASEVLAQEDGEIIYNEGDEPAQLRRYSSLERYRWVNPATGAEVEVEMPREDFLLTPISYQ